MHLSPTEKRSLTTPQRNVDAVSPSSPAGPFNHDEELIETRFVRPDLAG
jgi:hypothetical protein